MAKWTSSIKILFIQQALRSEHVVWYLHRKSQELENNLNNIKDIYTMQSGVIDTYNHAD